MKGQVSLGGSLAFFLSSSGPLQVSPAVGAAPPATPTAELLNC